MAKPRRILVIAREHIGDLVNSTAAIAEIVRAFPDSEITLEAGEKAIGILDNFPGIHHRWPRPTDQGALGKVQNIVRMREARFDAAFILDDSSRFVFESWLAGIPKRYGVWRKRSSRWFTAYAPFRMDQHDTLDAFRGVLEAAEVPLCDYRPRVYPSEADRANALSQIPFAPKTWIGISVGASRPYKMWPAENWIAVGKALQKQGHNLVIFGGPDDIATADSVALEIGVDIPNLAGKLSLLEFAAAIGTARLLITPDSGPMHVAAAMETPTVALFGPTDPNRYGPWGVGHQILQATCPCGRIPGSPCDGACMRAIQPEIVLEAMNRALNGS